MSLVNRVSARNSTSKEMHMLRQTVLVTLIATALFTSGCAVKPLNHNFSAIKDTRVCPEVADNNVDELCNAINLADGYRRGYLHQCH